MRKIALLLLFLVSLSLVSAADLSVELKSSQNIVFKELENNATYILSITSNEDQSDQYQIYTLVGSVLYPQGLFTINSGETITRTITSVPHKSTIENQEGFYSFQYEIKGVQSGFFKDFLTMKIISVKDAVDISVDNILVEDTETIITIKNKEKTIISDLTIEGDSKFFNFEETLSLGPEEETQITVPITKDGKLEAGEYDLSITYTLNGKESEETSSFNFLEKEGILQEESSEGFIVRRTTVTQTNEGNVAKTITISSRKDVLSRLFTIFSTKPDMTDRAGLFVDYTWERELGVGESITIETTTNYTFPFIFLIIILLVGFGTRYLISEKVSIKKRVAPVRTRGGEFAAKITLRIKARSHVSDLTLTDTIPRIAKLYEKYGAKPHHIDPKSRRVSWDIKSMSKGENRVFTYIIYSKINVVGNLHLPSASASYKSNGNREHSFSNKTILSSQTADAE